MVKVKPEVKYPHFKYITFNFIVTLHVLQYIVLFYTIRISFKFFKVIIYLLKSYTLTGNR